MIAALPQLKRPPAQPRSTGNDAVLTLAFNALFVLFATASGTVAARLLGPTRRGELAAIQMWAGFLVVIAMLGMGEAIVYFSAREPSRAGRHLGSAATIALTSSLLFMVLGYALMPWLLKAEPAPIVTAARHFLLQIPLAVIIGLSLQTLRGTGDFNFWNPMRIVLPALWFGLLASAWLLGCRNPALISYAYLAAMAAAAVPIAVIVKWRLQGSLMPDPTRWTPMLRFGLPCVFTALPLVLNLRMDQMLMAALIPARDLGLYAVAATWSGALSPMTGAVGLVLFPKVASQPLAQDAHRWLARGTRAAALLAVSVGLVLMLFTPIGLPILFGAKFSASIPSALILVVAAIFAGWNAAASAGLRGLGSPTAVLIAESCGLAVTAVALWMLLRRYGITGAAVASLLAYSTTSIVLLTQARLLTGLSLATLLCPRRSELYSGFAWLRDRASEFARPSQGAVD